MSSNGHSPNGSPHGDGASLTRPDRPLVIGTRGSPLALWQANTVRDLLMTTHGWTAASSVRLEIIKTSGDIIQDQALRAFGGKGLFTKEIEEALIARTIDLAVHSMKDMPTKLPDGLMIGCVLPREDVRDAFICHKAPRLADLPKGAVVGTSSLRRQAIVKHLRPDLEVITYRGNVETRLRKLDEGAVDATLLAYAGLKRLGLAHHVRALFETSEMLPAVAQGAIGIEIRSDDQPMATLLAPLHHVETALCLEVERAFLAGLDGSCRTPIAGLAQVSGDRLAFTGQILLPDGSEVHGDQWSGPRHAPADLGMAAAETLKARAGADFLARLV